VFYPEKLPKGKFLEYYAEHFDTVELNATFYQLPVLRSLEGMVRRTPPGFSFVVKAHQSLTHQRGKAAEEMLPAFKVALKPFAEGGKLGGILLQFPYSFKANPPNATYVRELAERIGEAPVIAEFRHKDWFVPDGLAWLRKHAISLCCVDEPELPNLPPPAAEVTGPVGYVRFHGRNSSAWWSPTAPDPAKPIGHEGPGDRSAGERYRYLYRANELEEWVPKLERMTAEAKHMFAFFNNHPEGHAVTNARDLKKLVA
jgi:uncharacterized protein YecE (DUF72 family)